MLLLLLLLLLGVRWICEIGSWPRESCDAGRRTAMWRVAGECRGGGRRVAARCDRRVRKHRRRRLPSLAAPQLPLHTPAAAWRAPSRVQRPSSVVQVQLCQPLCVERRAPSLWCWPLRLAAHRTRHPRAYQLWVDVCWPSACVGTHLAFRSWHEKAPEWSAPNQYIDTENPPASRRGGECSDVPASEGRLLS